MSDTDAEDDDGGIDKEALREELREKYERDEREREATQRMSDLLLKGATMTNSHCGACGDPLFRQNGTTFCPTCHGGPEGVEGPDLEEESDEPGVDSSAAGTESEPADAENGSAPADLDATGAPDVAAEGETDAGAADARPWAGEDVEPTGADTAADENASSARGRPANRGGRRRADARPAVSGDLGTARDSIVVALERFAGEAAETDDPRHARECLEAAHEAAEALSALER